MTAVAVRHSAYLTARSLRSLWRQPAFAAATLIQPIIWLLLFGAAVPVGRRDPGLRRRASPTSSSSPPA